ncbi:MAG: hypothetical protein EOS30_23580 [Mesorhizobium sp.]|nr:MAG: hypothetical protein EOS30_23580 [Mesorhizobium sp.]
MSLIWPAQVMRDPDVYVTDFSEYAIGVQPFDWTSRWLNTGFTALVQTVSGSISGSALRWTKTTANSQLLSWNRVPTVANAEIVCRMRVIEATSAPETFVRPCVRATGASGAENSYAMQPTKDASGSGWNNSFVKQVAGAGAVIGTPSLGPSPTFAINNWFWSRFRVIGTSLQRRAWWQGASEPGTWDESITDSAVTTAGWVGLRNTNVNPDCEIDFFAVAINGKTAPLVRK